ncbi:MAG: N-acetylmuramoyl-L-alanine amidase [Synechococcales bacterium]|nr:N-acetylmuramoyl-L-alanine amidase [Synechococcales bacterium]
MIQGYAAKTLNATGVALIGVMGALACLGEAPMAQAQLPGADSALTVVYPPDEHETTAAQIFFIGTAPPGQAVLINGQPIERSAAGHFAPSFPLTVGENQFTLQQGNESLTLTVRRVAITPPVPDGVGFAEGTLTPVVDIARMPGELICFEAIAPPNAMVEVSLANQSLPLLPQSAQVILPPNSAVLTFNNAPVPVTTTTYQGCGSFSDIGVLGQPQYQLQLGNQRVEQLAPGRVEILSPTQFQIAEVTAASGTARTGPSTDYSRLTPLPTGTQATITGREGDWYRLDYGAWIRNTDVTTRPGPTPSRSLIRSVMSRPATGWTEIVFPLQVPVPVSVDQDTDTLTLTLHNTTAQTDTIFLDNDVLIERLDWDQPSPDTVRYTFHLKTDQQWGYKLHYEGTSLILSLHHPPRINATSLATGDPDLPLAGANILLDPGHGGEELGARGPTGYPEKDANLVISTLLRDELIQRGARVYMTRASDTDVSLGDRVTMISEVAPDLALSIHYNALPDDGNANTAGIGTFWYHPQAHDPAVFLHDYLVRTLDRPSYGVFWNNLALTRPAVTPSVLLELGFMINPNEFEWIVDAEEQQRLAIALADGIEAWLVQKTR